MPGQGNLFSSMFRTLAVLTIPPVMASTLPPPATYHDINTFNMYRNVIVVAHRCVFTMIYIVDHMIFHNPHNPLWNGADLQGWDLCCLQSTSAALPAKVDRNASGNHATVPPTWMMIMPKISQTTQKTSSTMASWVLQTHWIRCWVHPGCRTINHMGEQLKQGK